MNAYTSNLLKVQDGVFQKQKSKPQSSKSQKPRSASSNGTRGQQTKKKSVEKTVINSALWKLALSKIGGISKKQIPKYNQSTRVNDQSHSTGNQLIKLERDYKRSSFLELLTDIKNPASQVIYDKACGQQAAPNLEKFQVGNLNHFKKFRAVETPKNGACIDLKVSRSSQQGLRDATSRKSQKNLQKSASKKRVGATSTVIPKKCKLMRFKQEVMDSLKNEIEKKYEKSDVNSSYKFPVSTASDGCNKSQEIGRKSMISLQDIFVYNLNDQNRKMKLDTKPNSKEIIFRKSDESNNSCTSTRSTGLARELKKIASCSTSLPPGIQKPNNGPSMGVHFSPLDVQAMDLSDSEQKVLESIIQSTKLGCQKGKFIRSVISALVERLHVHTSQQGQKSEGYQISYSLLQKLLASLQISESTKSPFHHVENLRLYTEESCKENDKNIENIPYPKKPNLNPNLSFSNKDIIGNFKLSNHPKKNIPQPESHCQKEEDSQQLDKNTDKILTLNIYNKLRQLRQREEVVEVDIDQQLKSHRISSESSTSNKSITRLDVDISGMLSERRSSQIDLESEQLNIFYRKSNSQTYGLSQQNWEKVKTIDQNQFSRSYRADQSKDQNHPAFKTKRTNSQSPKKLALKKTQELEYDYMFTASQNIGFQKDVQERQKLIGDSSSKADSTPQTNQPTSKKNKSSQKPSNIITAVEKDFSQGRRKLKKHQYQNLFLQDDDITRAS